MRESRPLTTYSRFRSELTELRTRRAWGCLYRRLVEEHVYILAWSKAIVMRP